MRLTEFPGYPRGSSRPMMQPEGRGTSGILAMGEALGEHEEKDELPFRPYAEAGSVLERALFRAGIPRDSLTITNLVWYRPPRNWLDGAPWEQEAIRACQPLNDALIERVRPRVILALGGMAFREMTGMAGEKQGIEMCRGFTIPGLRHQIPVVGTYHPSYLRRGSKERQEAGPKGKTKAAGGGTQGMSLLGVLIRDLQLAKDIAQDGVQEFKYDDYQLGGTLDDWRQALAMLKAHPDLLISYDFETQDSLQRESEEDAERTVREVTQVQISWRPGQALVSAWSPDLLPILREILELPNPKIDWNGRKFDRPILRDLGVRTDLGAWHDGMDFWHHAQPDLPRGLQYATSFFCPEVRPWKHLSHTSPLWYGALDVDMPQRIFCSLRTSLSLVREIHSGVSLWGDGQYGGYSGQVVKLAPVLDRMTERGIPVDEPHRQALDAQFTSTLNTIFDEMQGMVPDAIKGIHVLKKTKDVEEGQATSIKVKRGKATMEVPSTWRKIFQTELVKCGCGWSAPKRKALAEIPQDCPECGNSGKRTAEMERWAKVEPFLPGSWQQVLAYIKHRVAEDRAERVARLCAKGLDRDAAMLQADHQSPWEVPTDYKSGRETTGEAELRRLANKTKDPVLPKVLEYREIDKLRGTYVQGWAPGPDGRVHPSFGFKPSTGQLNSENPNAHNYPAHSELSKAMKKMICARPDRVFINFDYKSFHVLTLGFEAQDPLYMRMARNDMHSFFALCGLLRIEPPEKLVELADAELKAKLKWYRKQSTSFQAFGGWTFEQIRNEKAKRAILGIGFGQMERSLYMLNPESYASISEAKFVLDMLDQLFPLPAKWRIDIRLQADTQGCLVSRHGFVRRFYDVFQRKPVADNYQPRMGERVYVNGKTGQKWLLRNGDDSEACIAFLPANDAFGTIRSVMIRLKEKGLDDRFGLINQIHDSLVFECPKQHADECMTVVREEMERPNRMLTDAKIAPQGLHCGVDVKIGPTLADMQEI